MDNRITQYTLDMPILVYIYMHCKCPKIPQYYVAIDIHYVAINIHYVAINIHYVAINIHYVIICQFAP